MSGDWERVQDSPHKMPQLKDLDLISLRTTTSTVAKNVKTKFKVQKWRLWSKEKLGQDPSVGASCVVSPALFPNLQTLIYKQIDINNCCFAFGMF